MGTNNNNNMSAHITAMYGFLSEIQKELTEAHAQSAKNQTLQAENEALRRDIVQLQQRLSDSAEDLASLQRVSQIIAFEKENALLKNHVALLEKRLLAYTARAQADPLPPPPVIDKVEIEETNPQNQDDVEEYLEEEELVLHEVTIKKKAYYVSSDEHAYVYEKLDNEDVGACVGRLKTLSSGKLKIMPFES